MTSYLAYVLPIMYHSYLLHTQGNYWIVNLACIWAAKPWPLKLISHCCRPGLARPDGACIVGSSWEVYNSILRITLTYARTGSSLPVMATFLSVTQLEHPCSLLTADKDWDASFPLLLLVSKHHQVSWNLPRNWWTAVMQERHTGSWTWKGFCSTGGKSHRCSNELHIHYDGQFQVARVWTTVIPSYPDSKRRGKLRKTDPLGNVASKIHVCRLKLFPSFLVDVWCWRHCYSSRDISLKLTSHEHTIAAGAAG